METIIAIDPGPEKSAIVRYDGTIRSKNIISNKDMLFLLNGNVMVLDGEVFNGDILAVEMMACMGMAVGRSVLETCVWIGRFVEAWGGPWKYIYRMDVKMHLCNNSQAKDGNIRQALMDRYGSTRQAAIGTKKNKGPLYGFSKDMWSALAIAVTAHEGKS